MKKSEDEDMVKLKSFAFSKACFIWEIRENFNRYTMGCSYW